MSGLKGISKNLIWEKCKLANWILVIDLLVMVVMAIINLFMNGFSSLREIPAMFFTSVVIVNFISLILLARVNERVWVSNNYRLIPISETKLYLGNLLTTIGAMIYLQIIEAIFALICSIPSFINGSFSESLGFFPSETNVVELAIQFILVSLLGTILLWCGITLIHFVINWISGFLPFGKQKFVLFLVYLVVILLVLWAFNYIKGNILMIIYKNGLINSMGEISSAIWLTIGVEAVWIVCLSAINIYLLKRWIEPIH